ncbi:uncharacterized protein LOC119672716 [Teleopsis dalmanni]|uniref:uncharacterized protein LOC119672716 n=1 Tax=Teleopsis dalmanni TaxID=139649 RepID=UPI0018CE4F04|nr:uncharacterized protein LOC119672716 [Teleopsis dalmanni]
MMSNLDPKVATSQVKPGLQEFFKIYRTDVFGVKQDVENEWHQLQNKKWTHLSNTEEFYAEVSEDKDAAGNSRFKNVAKFATALLSLPFSNASVERAFSIYSIIKNKLRNKLSPEMLQALMMVRYTLQRQGSCINFNPTPAMLNKFDYKMYDFKNNLFAGLQTVSTISVYSISRRRIRIPCQIWKNNLHNLTEINISRR